MTAASSSRSVNVSVHTHGLRGAYVLLAVVDEEEVGRGGPHGDDAVMEGCRGRLRRFDLPGEGNVVQMVQPGLRGKEGVRVVRGDVGQQGDFGDVAEGLGVGDHRFVDA